MNTAKCELTEVVIPDLHRELSNTSLENIDRQKNAKPHKQYGQETHTAINQDLENYESPHMYDNVTMRSQILTKAFLTKQSKIQTWIC